MCRHVTLQDWHQAHHDRSGKALNLGSEERRETYWKVIEAQRAGYIGRHAEQFGQLLRTLKRRVLSAARDTVLTEQIPNAVEHALRGHRDEYRTQILNLYRAVWPAFASRTRNALLGESSSHVDWVRKQVRGRKQDDLEGYWERQAQAYVSNQGGVLIQEPVQTTKQRIMTATREAVSEGLQEGWGSERIARQIDNTTTNVVSRHRARRIARTETIRASNRSSVSGAQRTSQETGQNLMKEWIRTFDNRVRETHAAAGGQTVPLNANFTVGGFEAPYPAAPTLPAHESVLCRCTVSYSTRG